MVEKEQIEQKKNIKNKKSKNVKKLKSRYIIEINDRAQS